VKWYKVIECDNTVKKPFVCDSGNLEDSGFDQYYFKNGNIISNWNENMFLKASKKKNDGFPDDALQNYMMLPIFSSRLINELKKAEIGAFL